MRPRAFWAAGRPERIRFVTAVLLSCSWRRALVVLMAGLVLAAAPDLAAAQDEAAGEHHSLLPTIARVVNFALLVGILMYFLKAPIARYLTSRVDTVRHDLVAAETLRSGAQAQLAEVESKLAALPAELDALAARGRDELAREEERLRAATRREREKVLETTRREIDLQARIARRDLVEHAADLAVALARDRVAAQITPEDQARLVDRYTAEVRS
jgi:F-type H+-transporting ATPase subunit b